MLCWHSTSSAISVVQPNYYRMSAKLALFIKNSASPYSEVKVAK